MSRDSRSFLGGRFKRRAAAFVGIAAVGLVVLSSAVVWSQQTVACGVGSWPSELFCFSPGTPAKSNEINGNFLTLSRQGPPAGAIMSYAGNTEPDGWLFCDGRLVDISSYLDLYAAIGERYGSGSGQFALPDLRSRYMMGAANMGTDLTNAIVGSNTANHSHTITANHSHGEGTLGAHVAIAWDGLYWYYKKNDTELAAATTAGETWSATFSTGAVAPWGWGDTAAYPRTRVSGTTGAARTTSTAPSAPENRPSSYSMKYIIRY